MDKAKKQRKAQRASFTLALNAFKEAQRSKAANREVLILFKILEEKMNNLNVISESVIDIMLDDPAITEAMIEQEYSDADSYKSKFLSAKLDMDDVTAARDGTTSQITSPQTRSENKRDIELPKIELKIFSGEIREWLPFWSVFQKIHIRAEIAKEDKFQYLLQAMAPSSRAEKLVSSFPPTAENYDKVISCLKDRFGRDELQIEVIVRELLQLVLQNAVTPEKKIDIPTLYDKVSSHLRALETLGVTTDKFAAMLFPLVESSLPEELLRIWQRSTVDYSAMGKEDNKVESSDHRLKQLINFLAHEVRNEERISLAKESLKVKSTNNADQEKPKKEKNRASFHRDVPSATGLLTTKGRIKTAYCIFCDRNDHESARCEQAKKMSLPQRQECVKKKFACFNCLNKGHSYKYCRVKVKCPWCSRRHVMLMCPNMLKEGGENSEENVEKTIVQFGKCNATSVQRDPEVFLQTLRVKLFNGPREITIRAVIDTGSQKSYVTKEAAARVEYIPISEQLISHSLFGGQRSGTVKHKKYKVYLKSLDNKYRCEFSALDQQIICDSIPSIKSGSWCKELTDSDIKITDMNAEDHSVEALIGADMAGKLLTGRRHSLKCGLVAVETYLGWTIMGAAPDDEDERHDVAQTVRSMFVNARKIADLWSLDVLGITDPVENKTRVVRDLEIKDNFIKGVSMNHEGRYEVRLPWLENHPPVSDNKNLARRRLESTVRKLKSDGIYEDYDAIFKEWLAEGIIERVPTEEQNNWGHYLPHRHVVKEGSTTRIRPVFDASAKERHSPSLNECVEKGPNLIELITSNLLRFRKGKIGVISDIKKAFLQISIDVKDRDFLRFLWHDNHGDVIIFRHCRVVFGLTCSPFILSAIIEMHLKKCYESISNKAEKVHKNYILQLLLSFYVDNSLSSVNSVQELEEFMFSAKTVMESASFDLRGWEFTNDNAPKSQTAVLGICWDKEQDNLFLKVPAVDNFSDKVTKRSILSIAHKVFDPLGFASPIVLCPRILLQESWAENLSWDDEVSTNIKVKFLKWLDELKELNQMQVPRCLFGDINDNDKVSLHTFCDASSVAYAAVSFIRIEREEGIVVKFVQSKSRVAPANKENSSGRLSIPRLELLAATIGVRLTDSILKSLALENVDIFYWSDSSTVLAWIKRQSNWATFVYNRVNEIRTFSSPEQWRHVPGNSNPADLPSRGCTVAQLLISRWWEGPEWLGLKSGNWPFSDSQCNEEEINKEVKKSAQKNTVLLTSKYADDNKAWFSNKFSSYSRIIRVFAWVQRFYFNIRKSVESRDKGNLTFDEIKSAEIRLLKMIQAEYFSEGENDARIRSLQPVKDKDNLIRLNTKIVLREDAYNFRCPIILPGNHEIIHLIINEKHLELNHAGVEITMSALREQFWIMGGRKVIRTVINKCVTCRRHDAKPLDSLPAPLPLNRIRDAAVFEIVGVDFTGPLYLKCGQKAWICLFTCAVFRAVHLELVTSLSTASFLMALRRHIARRGRPSVIYSDNGTNFVGLNNIFKSVDFDKLASVAATKQIEWKFNPPTAAWWGGFWERLIGILKRLLRRTLKKSCLNYEEMLTVLLDCEAVINSRPITFMSEKNEIVPLTPSMFLQEIKEIGVLDFDSIENIRFEKRFRYRQKIKDDLRRRFRNEYLGALVHKDKKWKCNNKINVGDIVFVQSDNVKRMDWPLARVKHLITGKDGNIRVVQLITAGGEMIRPIQRIYPLELKYDCAEQKELIIKNYKKSKCKFDSENSGEVPEASEFKDSRAKENESIYVTKAGRKVVKPERLNYE